jgi:hypothetical protein
MKWVAVLLVLIILLPTFFHGIIIHTYFLRFLQFNSAGKTLFLLTNLALFTTIVYPGKQRSFCGIEGLNMLKYF